MPTQAEHQYQVDKARQALLRLARDRGAGIKLPTVLEMLSDFEVTRTQLEQALTELERAGFLIRRRGSGIYGTERVAQKTIGVVFGGDIFSPNFSPFWGLLLQAVQEQAGECGFTPRAYLDIAGDSRGLGGHEQLLEDLEARCLDGILLMAPHYMHDHAGQLRQYGVPVVSTADVAGTGRSGQDWAAAFLRLAAAELAVAGCSRVGLLGPPDRRAALENEMHAAGIPYVHVADWSYETWSWILPNAYTREICAHALTKGMIAARSATPLPDALVSFEDTMTRGAITALHQAGLQPGRDIRIISLGNAGSPLLEPYADSITMIEIDPAEFVAVMLERLDSLVSGRQAPEPPAAIVPRLRSTLSEISNELPLAAIMETLEQARPTDAESAATFGFRSGDSP